MGSAWKSWELLGSLQAMPPLVWCSDETKSSSESAFVGASKSASFPDGHTPESIARRD